MSDPQLQRRSYNVNKWLYNLQVWLARRFFPARSSPMAVRLAAGPGNSLEVALCRRTPYYSELIAKLESAQSYFALPDAALAPFEIRLVPDWFNVIISHDPWDEIRCMGVVAMDVREIRVAFRGDNGEEDNWERTLVHEFAHIYCQEHPELGYGWDPSHKCTEVWDKVNEYYFVPKK